MLAHHREKLASSLPQFGFCKEPFKKKFTDYAWPLAGLHLEINFRVTYVRNCISYQKI